MGHKAIEFAEKGEYYINGLGCEVRPADPVVFFRMNEEPAPRLSFWFRYKPSEIMGVYEDIKDTFWSEALVAFLSDYRITGPALRQNPNYGNSKSSTLSHSIWFSPLPFQLNSPSEWLFYDTKAVMSGNNTILTEGNLFNENKQLLAITKQLALCRPTTTKVEYFHIG